MPMVKRYIFIVKGSAWYKKNVSKIIKINWIEKMRLYNCCVVSISHYFLIHLTTSHIVVEHIDINESPIDEVKGKHLGEYISQGLIVSILYSNIVWKLRYYPIGHDRKTTKNDQEAIRADASKDEFEGETTRREKLPNQTLEMMDAFPELEYVHQEQKEGKPEGF